MHATVCILAVKVRYQGKGFTKFAGREEFIDSVLKYFEHTFLLDSVEYAHSKIPPKMFGPYGTKRF